MKTRIVTFIAAIVITFVNLTNATAAGEWRNHAAPLDFLFDNEIDTHQQTRLTHAGGLFGFFYIKFSGQVTTDGYRIAKHVDCNKESGCTVGWLLRGQRGTGTFLYHVMGEHPVWLVRRSDIPQPGGYSHFHWLGSAHPMPNESRNGYFLELTALDTFCFVHHEHAEVPTSPANCEGHAGVIVTPGLDLATHLNIVASFPADTDHR